MYNLNDLIKETMMKQPLLMLTVLLVTACSSTTGISKEEMARLDARHAEFMGKVAVETDCDKLAKSKTVLEESLVSLNKAKNFNHGANVLSVGAALLSFDPTDLADINSGADIQHQIQQVEEEITAVKRRAAVVCGS